MTEYIEHISQAILNAEIAIANELDGLKPHQQKLAEREIARNLLRGNLLGRAAAQSNPLAVQLADQIWEVALAMLQYRHADKVVASDFLALLFDHASHLMEDLFDG